MSQVATNSSHDSAISSTSGCNNGLATKSEDSIPLSANNVSNNN